MSSLGLQRACMQAPRTSLPNAVPYPVHFPAQCTSLPNAQTCSSALVAVNIDIGMSWTLAAACSAVSCEECIVATPDLN